MVTHAYGDRTGVRFLSTFLKVIFPQPSFICQHSLFLLVEWILRIKAQLRTSLFHWELNFHYRSLCSVQVYYLPIQTFYNQVTLPTIVAAMPLLREVIIREGITILHGHGVRGEEWRGERGGVEG